MATFVNDTFTDTDGVLLESHTRDDAGTWTKHSASAQTMGIWGNRCDGSNANKTSLYYGSGTPASQDYDVSADFYKKSPQLAKTFIAGRQSTSANTHYRLQYDEDTSNWRLSKCVTGSVTILGSYTHAIAQGATESVVLHIRDAGHSADIAEHTGAITSTDNVITAAGVAAVGQATRGFGGGFGQHLDNFSAADAPPTATGTAAVPLASLGVTATGTITTSTPDATGTAVVPLASLGASGTGDVLPTCTGTGTVPLASLGASGTGALLPDIAATGSVPLVSLGVSATGDVLPTRTGTASVPLASLGAMGSGVVSAFPEITGTGSVPVASLGVSGEGALGRTASGSVPLASLGASGTADLTAERTASGSASVASLGVTGSASVVPWPEALATGSAGLCSLGVVASAQKWLPLTATASVALPTVRVTATGTVGEATYCILDDIATLLEPVAGSSVGWPIYKGLMPDTADAGQAIGLYERGGEPMLWGVNVDLPVVGVLVRGKSMAQASTAYQTTRDMAETVVRTLHDQGPVTVHARDYYAILSRDEPAYEGEDERQRPAFSCSFAVTAASTA